MHSFSTLLRFIWRSSKRAAVFLVGVGLVGVGLVLFVTPGPGIVLVVAGLAVLATEFAWAEHLLDKAKRSAAKAGQSAQRLPGVSRATSAARRVLPARWRRDPAAGGEATEASPETDAGSADEGADTGAAAASGSSDTDGPTAPTEQTTGRGSVDAPHEADAEVDLRVSGGATGSPPTADDRAAGASTASDGATG